MAQSEAQRAATSARIKALMADPARQEAFRESRLKGSRRAAELRMLRHPKPTEPKQRRKYEYILREFGIEMARKAFGLVPDQMGAK